MGGIGSGHTKSGKVKEVEELLPYFSDIEIATKVGLSRERIRQIRLGDEYRAMKRKIEREKYSKTLIIL